LLFCGTPQFAVPTLEYLLAQNDFEIVGVITQPGPGRAGAGTKFLFSAVKEARWRAKLPRWLHSLKRFGRPKARSC